MQDYELYKNSQNGNAYNPAMPTFGITPSHMPSSEFSYNPFQYFCGFSLRTLTS